MLNQKQNFLFCSLLIFTSFSLEGNILSRIASYFFMNYLTQGTLYLAWNLIDEERWRADIESKLKIKWRGIPTNKYEYTMSSLLELWKKSWNTNTKNLNGFIHQPNMQWMDHQKLRSWNIPRQYHNVTILHQ